MATPPKPTREQQRAEKRAAQLEAFKKREAAQKRNRLLGIVAAVVALVLVVGVVGVVIWTNAAPPSNEVDEELLSGDYRDRLQTFDDLDATHTEGRVSYDQSPPVGGAHNPAWLNCGVYAEEQTREYAVHSLEHGAVWITYDPAVATDAEVGALVELAPDTYTIISPYPGLGEAMAISAWGAQLRFTEVDDPAVEDFLTEFWRAPSSPEPNAPCTGAIDGPGKVS
jgi:Protein of unknown function (DUF3105).